ncbi:MAG: carboxypeptidase regulatory-like domain-containing protein [bacterium]
MSGFVRQSTERLAGVHVALAGTRFETATDVDGRFSFGVVRAGDYTLTAMRMGYTPVREQIHVEAAGAPLELSMTPVAVPVAAVIVTPGYFGVMQSGLATAQALTRQQIETVPQLGEDVYRAVGRLPGVATSDMSARFVVRGEPSNALSVTLDGLPLVEPFHLKDLGDGLSIIDLTVLAGAELITGGPSAEHGDNLAGVFRLHTVEPRVDRTRAAVGLSLTNVRGMAQGGFANGKGGWLVSGRRGYLDLAFKLAGNADSIYPQYNDPRHFT